VVIAADVFLLLLLNPNPSGRKEREGGRGKVMRRMRRRGGKKGNAEGGEE
jgi:hypothetical protein